MDWFKQNPFLGLLAVTTALAALGSGYFLYDSFSRYQAATGEFEGQVQTLQRLQSNKPFPNEENVRLTRAELDDARATLEQIGQTLKVEAPATRPQGFQDQLRETVNEITARAGTEGVTLGEGFYLGFEAYETQPPSTEAAAPLALQLRSIASVTSILLDAKVREITAIARTALPAEAPAEKTDQPDRRGEAAKPDEGGLPDLVLSPFDITFTTEQAALRTALNRILEVEPPVFIRLVSITNEAPTGPAKDGGDKDAAAADAIKPILGQEALVVTLRLAALSAGAAANP